MVSITSVQVLQTFWDWLQIVDQLLLFGIIRLL